MRTYAVVEFYSGLYLFVLNLNISIFRDGKSAPILYSSRSTVTSVKKKDWLK